MKLLANFKLKKYQNFSIQFEKPSIINIQLFAVINVMGKNSHAFIFKALDVLSMLKINFYDYLNSEGWLLLHKC